ncbi:hypothetical protein SH668x_003231 [Planctomicrobium sp. SH668]|uniref:hypothetical protein n=1 Tax=Planctomicrobium sp. SH668 TaxID=3448126 RepID=UPI003F5C2775
MKLEGGDHYGQQWLAMPVAPNEKLWWSRPFSFVGLSTIYLENRWLWFVSKRATRLKGSGEQSPRFL